MMGHWNHRVIRRTIVEFDEPVEWFGIHETFYGLDGETGPVWTDDATSVEGGSVQQLRETLERMIRALDKPVIIANEKEHGAK